MRKSFALIAVGALVLGTSTAATAATLPFTASATITVGTLPAVPVSGSGNGTSNGVGGAATIPAGSFSLMFTTAVAPPLLGAIFGFAIGGTGQGGNTAPFAAGSNNALNFGGTTGTMGLNASAYLLNSKNKAIAAIPLGIIGVGGSVTFSALGLITGTIQANPYQLGMVMVTGTQAGDPPVMLTGTGSDNRTAGGSGTLTLVSPTFIALGVAGTLPALAVLEINYAPEPGALLLVGAAVATLVAVSRKKMA